MNEFTPVRDLVAQLQQLQTAADALGVKIDALAIKAAWVFGLGVVAPLWLIALGTIGRGGRR